MINQRKQSIKSLLTNKTLLLILLVFTSVSISAQDKKEFLSAKESEPNNFGWMQGFPPSADKTLNVADGSFFEFPALRWGVGNVAYNKGLSGLGGSARLRIRFR